MFGRLRTKRLTAPPNDVTKDEHVTVSITTPAAAEAGVAAAQVAAEVVPPYGTLHSNHTYDGETDERALDVQELAATKIQSTFRGYLVSSSLY